MNPIHHVVVIQSPDGTIEQFTTRLGEQSIAEWLMDRDQLRASGAPDRPPDVDTRTLRAWAMRPGEENLAYFKREAERKAIGAFPVMTLRWENEHRNLILLVTGWPDGGFSVDILDSEIGAMVHRDYGAGLPPEEVWEHIEGGIGIIEEGGHWTDPPDVSYLWDFEAIDFDLEVARIEFERGFINPLGEARA